MRKGTRVHEAVCLNERINVHRCASGSECVWMRGVCEWLAGVCGRARVYTMCVRVLVYVYVYEGSVCMDKYVSVCVCQCKCVQVWE